MVKRIMYRQFDARGNSHSFGRGLRTAVVALLYAFLLSGCGGNSEPESVADGELRIVSFSPALSRMVVDFGLEKNIVGRTPYCDFLNPNVPVVGDLLNVDYERLIDVQPTHVLIQASSGGADGRLLELCTEHHWKVGQWTALNTIDDIEQVVRDLPGVLYENESKARESAARRAAELLNEIALALSPGDADSLWSGDVLMVYRTVPVGVFGRHTYLSDILARLGASNAVEGDGWLELTLEDVARMNPPAIIIIQPGASAEVNAIEAAGPLGRMEIDAVKNNRVCVLRSASALLPSTGIIEVAGELRAALRKLAQRGVIDDNEQAPAQ